MGNPFSESFCDLLSCLVTVGDMSVFSRVAFVLPLFSDHRVNLFLVCSLVYYYFLISEGCVRFLHNLFTNIATLQKIETLIA